MKAKFSQLLILYGLISVLAANMVMILYHPEISSLERNSLMQLITIMKIITVAFIAYWCGAIFYQGVLKWQNRHTLTKKR